MKSTNEERIAEAAERKANVLELHHQGLSRAEIATRLNLSVDYVYRVQKDAGIARPANRTALSMGGGNLADPRRADRVLRRFSWESGQ